MIFFKYLQNECDLSLTLNKAEWQIKPWNFINYGEWWLSNLCPVNTNLHRETQLSDWTLREHQGNVGFQKVFIQSELFDEKPVIQWICFGRCLLTDILAADDGSSVWDEETKRL